ncbi:Imm45 family immunity protein [Rhizobium sp. LjRoot30]|uniref:Imm45 family immunity protein n=1 Tax=Rhizobium sp. LjRoot30 TaxID=3342320 RepID=UPI003ED10025
MVRLTETAAEALWIGDILRLPENYDLGPGSPPVDLIVYEPNDEECGLGLLVISGYKAGLIYALLPLSSLLSGTRALDIGWLKNNWDRWFCYEHGDDMRVIDINEAQIFAWDKRTIEGKA